MKYTLSALVLSAVCASSFSQTNNRNDNIIPSGTFSSTFASSDVYNPGGKCTQVMINITSLTGQPSMEPHLQGKDVVSGNYYDILIGDILNSVGETVLTVCPGVENTRHSMAANMLPQYYRIQFLFNGAGSATMSVESNHND